MYAIKSIRATRTFACPGEYAYNAEAQISVWKNDKDPGKQLFVNACWAMGDTFYSYGLFPEYDYMTGATEKEPEGEHVEAFTSLEDAQNSEFIDLYRMLDKILYDMFHGPETAITDQAKLDKIITTGEALDENADTYYFSAVCSLKYKKEKYEAAFSIETDNEVSISLKKGNTVVEQFEDLENAAYSEWFMLYCKLKKELMSYINKYEKETKKLGGTYSYIMSDLLNDH